jgi:Domain of unknown function (DUF4893)
MVRIHSVILAAALAAAASPALAGWKEQAAPADIERLVQLPQIREAAIADALHGDGRGDPRVIAPLMQPEGRGVPAQALLGNWRCRQVKLGRMTSYMVYDSWFTCNIRHTPSGLILQKEGTQRMLGFLYPENGAWVYLGASSAKGEPWHNYSGNAPSLGASVTPDDQIGLLTGIGNNRLRLEIPAVQESLLDVLEFTR